MTERLYYHDAYLREFDAQVLECRPAGERFCVLLDRTAFYPSSGGQPHDTGSLGNAQVLEVVDEDDQTVAHFTDRAIAPGAIHGIIDWDRRFDHMQQHTGQHLLSAAFISLFDFHTVSFHLGSDLSTIDIASPGVTLEQLEETEHFTNRIIFEDRAVKIEFATSAQLAAAGVRKTVDREGILRAIAVEDFDRQPCGGTHVARTGQVGLILLRKLEKQKQNWRIEFVCGYRALRATRGDFGLLNESARLLSCGLPEIPRVMKKMMDERQATQKSRQRLLENLAGYEAQAMLREGAKAAVAELRIIEKVFSDAEFNYLRMLATELAKEAGVVALLATAAGGNIVFARSAELPLDMNQVLRAAVTATGGKGGGTPAFAQGSIPDAAFLSKVIADARNALKG